MAKQVQCIVLKQTSEGLDQPPYPGELGQRIYDNVSKAGWAQWLERLATIINENGLNTADVKNFNIIEKHMLGFLFNEGDGGNLPSGFRQSGGK